MLKVAYSPNAYLIQRRNVRLGLEARSKILQVVESQASTISHIRDATGLKYPVVLYHMKLLEKERIVQKQGGKKPYLWKLTGLGQSRLIGV